MKKPSELFELIGQIREAHYEGRFLNKNRIVDYAVNNYAKFLNSLQVVEVCKILLKNISENYTLDEMIDQSIYDYIQGERTLDKRL